MNRDLYSNTELSALREQLNQEIQRRGTFKWWDPLTTPTVGQDRTSPLSLPDEGVRVPVDDKTYTINNPSEGSIERTRNIAYPAHGEFPAGEESITNQNSAPSTSAAQINADEMRNALVGLAKIQDIDLFYGRDETARLVFRDPKGIEDALKAAQESIASIPLQDSDVSPSGFDPNGGETDRRNPNWPQQTKFTYHSENGKYVMPSGERDGEEVTGTGLGPDNFFDDHGAPEGQGDFHPYNPAYSPVVDRSTEEKNTTGTPITTKIIKGGIPSSAYGKNPRNPVDGNAFPSRQVFAGKATSCNVACTGLCSLTCDNQCSESCSTTCWNRCGDACTSTCGNVCTGCTTMCYNTCKTKCENVTGYSCLKAGAKTVKVTATGGRNGVPAKNEISAEVYTCTGCSYTCQFYPNKKTTCWDAGCMGKCFTTCESSCSTSCYGGCVDNTAEEGNSYQTGHGRGCSAGCTMNCVGSCSGVCEGYCVNTCFEGCKSTCSDNCAWTCSTDCGTGCEVGCTYGCDTYCEGKAENKACEHGCDSTCEHGCSKNCVAIGCRAICGAGDTDACEANCRMNCMSASCTSLCSDACSSQCTTCVNTCGFQCGACSSKCSTGCEAACNITCTATCEQSCEINCVHSCSEQCGGCSNLCYSCVAMCIGTCSVKCEVTCTNCTNMCSWWCDTSCSKECFGDCASKCISNCSGSCATFVSSKTTTASGPATDPTAEGYHTPHPSNRQEEMESYEIFSEIDPYQAPEKNYLITVMINKRKTKNRLIITSDVVKSWLVYQTTINGGVFTIDEEGEIVVNKKMLDPEVATNRPNFDDSSTVYIIVLTTDDIEITEDDIDYQLPVGFSGHLAIPAEQETSDGTTMIVIEKDMFIYYGDHSETTGSAINPNVEGCDECDEWNQMSSSTVRGIYDGSTTITEEETEEFMTVEEMDEIWHSDVDPTTIPTADSCECETMREMTDEEIEERWDR